MKQRIILAGGSGFLGQALAAHFLRLNWEIVVLTRSPKQRSDGVTEVQWDASTRGPWQESLDGAAAVVNLTGKSVDCRYTARNRKEIMESRVNSTRAIGEAIAQCANPPPVWLNASTATLYRHTFGDAWDETGAMDPVAEAKDAFSVEVAKAWELTLEKANTPRTRKIPIRMAMVLGFGENSVFPVLRRLVRFGLGGKMGSGKQYVSWMHETDFCRAVEFLIGHAELSGPINLVAPEPVMNAEMMRLHRRECGVPFGLPAAEWMLELGAFFLRTETELILKSRRVVPGRLLKSGFEFQFPTLTLAFKDLANRLR